jgi:hypothetical protein
MNDYKYISENYKNIIENVEKAKSDYNINEKIRIMAVTKGVEHEKVNFAVNEGITLLGENKVQEFLQKKQYYPKNCEIHFIGGLQSNKIKYIINQVKLIQSADSVKLITEINKKAATYNLIMDLLLEVNIGQEDTKHGVLKSGLTELIQQAEKLENVRLRGLMAIPPYNAEEKIYAEMNKLYNEAKETVKSSSEFDILSMGMSEDYTVAIKHGANLIRIGSALFGSR